MTTRISADICEATDVATWERLKLALKDIGAELIGEHPSSLGVVLIEYRIDDEVFNVFVDNWFIDVEGPETVVKKVLALCSLR